MRVSIYDIRAKWPALRAAGQPFVLVDGPLDTHGCNEYPVDPARVPAGFRPTIAAGRLRLGRAWIDNMLCPFPGTEIPDGGGDYLAIREVEVA